MITEPPVTATVIFFLLLTKQNITKWRGRGALTGGQQCEVVGGGVRGGVWVKLLSH